MGAAQEDYEAMQDAGCSDEPQPRYTYAYLMLVGWSVLRDGEPHETGLPSRWRAKRRADELTIGDKPVLWRNAFGEPVDLDKIDKRYALNILTMVLRRTRNDATANDLRHDPLIQKLRDVVLNGRDPDDSDLPKAHDYNARCEAEGLPFRADVSV